MLSGYPVTMRRGPERPVGLDGVALELFGNSEDDDCSELNSLPSRGETDPMLDAYKPGLYVLTSNAGVLPSPALARKGPHKKKDFLSMLKAGVQVRVLEVVHRKEEQRIRGRIDESGVVGWISLVNTETGHCWATQVPTRLGLPSGGSEPSDVWDILNAAGQYTAKHIEPTISSGLQSLGATASELGATATEWFWEPPSSARSAVAAASAAASPCAQKATAPRVQQRPTNYRPPQPWAMSLRPQNAALENVEEIVSRSSASAPAVKTAKGLCDGLGQLRQRVASLKEQCASLEAMSKECFDEVEATKNHIAEGGNKDIAAEHVRLMSELAPQLWWAESDAILTQSTARSHRADPYDEGLAVLRKYVDSVTTSANPSGAASPAGAPQAIDHAPGLFIGSGASAFHEPVTAPTRGGMPTSNGGAFMSSASVAKYCAPCHDEARRNAGTPYHDEARRDAGFKSQPVVPPLRLPTSGGEFLNSNSFDCPAFVGSNGMPLPMSQDIHPLSCSSSHWSNGTSFPAVSATSGWMQGPHAQQAPFGLQPPLGLSVPQVSTPVQTPVPTPRGGSFGREPCIAPAWPNLTTWPPAVQLPQQGYGGLSVF